MNQRISEITTPETYLQRYQESLSQTDSYWTEKAKDFLWHKDFNQVQSGTFEAGNIEWFKGGELNITENIFERNLAIFKDKKAIIWEPNNPKDESLTLTYGELHKKVNQFANVLKEQGVQKGDRVVFYMSMIPELLIGCLATARLGAVHCVVFGGFSAKALRERVIDSGAKIIITNDGGMRGSKPVELKSICDEALSEQTTVEKVLCYKHLRDQLTITMHEGRDIELNNLLANASDECAPTVVGSEDPLFILYTSGSTGKPKGLLHTTAGYMAWTSETFRHVFQSNTEEDIFWCTADIGWITGHSYMLYGPLLNGATQVMFEGVPSFPDAGRFWDVVDKYKVTHFYTAPTAIRALEACDESLVNSKDLSSLKVLGSVGEPINEEAWQWYYEKVGKSQTPIVDTWWQTETGGIMISALAGITESIPTYANTPLPAIEPILVDNEGNELDSTSSEGNLCIKKPWPGMARTIWGDHERYLQTYFTSFKGYYFTGDGAKTDDKGRFRILGRVDDVINVSGHRLGTAEIEDVINEHHHIVESAVVGIPHPIKGQGVLAVVIPFHGETVESGNSHKEELLNELNSLLVKDIGPIAKIDQLWIAKDLPKTRSGKIMRRIIRKLATGEDDRLGDISTLLNPEVIDFLKREAKGI